MKMLVIKSINSLCNAGLPDMKVGMAETEQEGVQEASLSERRLVLPREEEQPRKDCVQNQPHLEVVGDVNPGALPLLKGHAVAAPLLPVPLTQLRGRNRWASDSPREAQSVCLLGPTGVVFSAPVALSRTPQKPSDSDAIRGSLQKEVASEMLLVASDPCSLLGDGRALSQGS